MSSDRTLYAYLHGKIVPLESACLHISDLSIQRGYGVFDYFKILHGKPLFLDDYLDRFYQSAKLMELPVPLSREELEGVVFQLLERNNLEVSGMKLILTGGYSPTGYEPVQPNLLISQQLLALPQPAQFQAGIKIITYPYVREMPTAKTINYTMGIRLIRQIKEQGANDVLYHKEGIVTELPRCNFFIVKRDNTIVTPAENVLAGITRKKVLELASQRYRAETGVVHLADIAQAKEAFLTSTTKRIIPVVQMNDTLIGTGKPGPVTLSLLEELIRLEEQYLA